MPTSDPYRAPRFVAHDLEVTADGRVVVMDRSYADDDERCCGIHNIVFGADDVQLDDDATKGDLFHVGAVGLVPVRLLVGDVPEDERPKRAERSVRDLLLHVPSGKLLIAPIDRWNPRLDDQRPEGVTVDVPPGSHSLETWVLPSEEEALSPGVARREKLAGTLGCMGAAGTMVAVFAMIVAFVVPIPQVGVGILLGTVIYWVGYALLMKRMKAKHGEPPVRRTPILLILRPDPSPIPTCGGSL